VVVDIHGEFAKRGIATTGDIAVTKEFFKHMLISDQVSAVGHKTKIHLDSLKYYTHRQINWLIFYVLDNNSSTCTHFY